jgi:hypothetical protein
MKKNSRKQTNATKHDGPGRPKYTPCFPRSKEWTFTDFMEVNGINTNSNSKEFGKGPNCTMLTLRKFMARDAKRMGKSLIFKVKDVTSEPNSKDGLGRRAYLYSLRANANVKRGSASPKVSTPRKAKAATAAAAPSDVSDSTKRYEEIKAILATPTPAPAAVTVPAVTIAPPAPEAAPAPAPVAETPAPVAQESANAETATPVAQPA